MHNFNLLNNNNKYNNKTFSHLLLQHNSLHRISKYNKINNKMFLIKINRIKVFKNIIINYLLQHINSIHKICHKDIIYYKQIKINYINNNLNNKYKNHNNWDIK